MENFVSLQPFQARTTILCGWGFVYGGYSARQNIQITTTTVALRNRFLGPCPGFKLFQMPFRKGCGYGTWGIRRLKISRRPYDFDINFDLVQVAFRYEMTKRIIYCYANTTAHITRRYYGAFRDCRGDNIVTACPTSQKLLMRNKILRINLP